MEIDSNHAIRRPSLLGIRRVWGSLSFLRLLLYLPEDMKYPGGSGGSRIPRWPPPQPPPRVNFDTFWGAVPTLETPPFFNAFLKAPKSSQNRPKSSENRPQDSPKTAPK